MQRRMVLGGLMAMAASAACARVDEGPKVVSTVPADGDLDVDPALASFTVVFDRPMRRSWSFVTKGDGAMPEVGRPELVDERTVVASLVLEPGRDYVVWLNSDRYRNFADQAGRPATPTRIAFRTRSKQA
jgi:hypothetical protein